MLIQRMEREMLNGFFRSTGLISRNDIPDKDKSRKIEQILSYLEIIHSLMRKYSMKRKLLFIESCAGNCYLSFLVYYYYSHINPRPVEIHCVDIDDKLMDKSKALADELGFTDMHFHTSDILDYRQDCVPDLVYNLHACDTATDKALFLAMKNRAKNILSVSCCQHSIRKRMRGSRFWGISRHGVFKERMVYIVADSLRALLMEMEGYETEILEFTSSRFTDKNVMIRARRGQGADADILKEEYRRIRSEFKVAPALERYLKDRYLPNTE